MAQIQIVISTKSFEGITLQGFSISLPFSIEVLEHHATEM